ncbi:MAG: hypothetical protein U0893_27830 [Chloroflexota bacterium]
MKREIVELDDLLLIEAEHVAAQNGMTLNEVIAVALRQWVDANRKPNRLSFVGIFEGDGSSSDPEELDRQLREGLHPHEGWSHERTGSVAKDPQEAKP